MEKCMVSSTYSQKMFEMSIKWKIREIDDFPEGEPK